MNNFLITGISRSGTKFLAQTMNKSKVFKVEHDENHRPIIHSKDTQINKWNKKFNKENFGKVSGCLRHYFDLFEASQKGIIVRNPIDCYFSICNMNGVKKVGLNFFKKRFKEDLVLIDRYIESYNVIEFKRMTTDKDYLQEVFNKYGIEDVKITTKILNKKINVKTKKFKNLSVLPFGLGNFFKEEAEWFLEKHSNLV